MLKSFLILVLLGCVAQINSENVPALIWGGKSDGQFPALHSLTSDEFATFVKSQANKDSMTIVFVENSLSVEDLSHCRSSTSKSSCFENLRKVEKKTYLTAVDDPVKALESSVSSYGEVHLSNDDDDLNGKLDKTANSKFVFVYLDDVESNEDFVKHDELISKVYNLIASKGENVIAIYTGRHPSFIYSKPLIRKTRDTSGKQDTPVEEDRNKTFHDTPNVLYAVSNIYYNDQVLDISTLVAESNISADKSHIGFSMTIGTFSLRFDFLLSGGTWEASEIDFAEGGSTSRRLRAHAPVDAYEGKSFGCGNLTITDATNYIILENFQIQPHWSEEPMPEPKRFAKGHNDCVGYFSPAIWGALFVVIIMLFVLSYGFTMIMDIRTMDRFDDPKGKTITINTQE